MDQRARPYRSTLYIPGSKARALDKARRLPADAIIFDLEDAVALTEKQAARDLLRQVLEEGGYGARAKICRINGFDTEWGRDDLAAMAACAPDAILIPKVESPEPIRMAAAMLEDVPGCEATEIWAMMETPRGILNVGEIVPAPRMGGLVMGTNDLAKELMIRNRADREPLLTSLQLCLLAARAAGLTILDGVYNAFRDAEGLAAECAQGRDMGFDGKTLIHPDQIAAANAAFAPSTEEIATAQRQIAAQAEAAACGEGVAVVDGRIVETLHIVTAKQTLARAAAIAKLEEGVA
ncbi:HpcH/HpaI aldolase/citrate lyase family protein [Mangrovicoccus algicola]|uniref:CoA ester lyase n=1 Tax=Mangrovicoccus algicola TaxID=2771008 RepID=A0A8J7CSZ5_9RHOB|nr:CoA ester lyase [Mangrovicoccus algicola]MBE3636689.1 CoA ester lyase [Mangrovicoccus algicola]